LTHKLTQIEGLYRTFHELTDPELLSVFSELRTFAHSGASMNSLEARLFALIKVAAERKVGLVAYDTQLLAALILRRDHVIQMDTGEGKTLVAPFAAIAHAVSGSTVVIATANDYLASRDYTWMEPLYTFLKIPVSVVEKWQNNRQKTSVYSCQVIYSSATQLIFDFLDGQRAIDRRDTYSIPFSAVIIDEIDHVLIDEGARPLAISSTVAWQSDLFRSIEDSIARFKLGEHFFASPKAKILELTAAGRSLVYSIAQELHVDALECGFYIRSALEAHHLYTRDLDYIVDNDRIVLLQETTGRPQPSLFAPFGLQQALEQKENLILSPPRTVTNHISIASFFSKYQHVSGMSGSAAHNAIELRLIFGLDVVKIPPRLKCVRQDQSDLLYRGKAEQLAAARDAATAYAATGGATLIGTTNITDAESLAALFTDSSRPVRLLTARNDADEAEIIEHAGQPGAITIAARMAGRGVDIRLHETVRQAGGLRIIGIGRAEDRRLDDQLKGRSGRQGDPGSSVFLISEEDELNALFAGRLISTTNQSSDANAPSNRRRLSRRIAYAQESLVLMRYYQRRMLRLFDFFTEALRAKTFAVRYSLLMGRSAQLYIDGLVNRRINAAFDAPDVLRQETFEHFFATARIRADVNYWQSASLEKTDLAKDLRTQVLSSYNDRRRHLGRWGLPRERMIVLRSIDYCWSRFLSSWYDQFSALLLAAPESRHESLAALRAAFARQEQIFRLSLDETTLYYLQRIDDLQAAQEIKYWRGLSSGNGGASKDRDGVPNPPSASRPPLTTSDTTARDTFRVPSYVSRAAPQKLTVEAMISIYLQALQAKGKGTRSISRAESILRSFAHFVGHNDRLVHLAQYIGPYIRSLRAQHISYLNRRLQRSVLIDFLHMLAALGLIGAGAITKTDLVLTYVRAAGATLMEPYFWLQLCAGLLLTMLYLSVTRLPLPYLGIAEPRGLFPGIISSIDSYAFRFSISRLTFGILGIVPFWLTSRWFSGQRSHFSQTQPLRVYLPAGILLAVGFHFVASYFLPAFRILPVWRKLTVDIAVLGGGLGVTLYAWLLQFTELGDPIAFTIAINAAYILTSAIAGATSKYLIVTSVAFVTLLYALTRRAGRLRVELIQHGQFDFEAGEIRKRTVTASVDVREPYHLLYALVIWSSCVLPILLYVSNFRSHGAVRQQVAVLTVTSLLTYSGIVLWVVGRRAKFEYSVRNIVSYLESHHFFVATDTPAGNVTEVFAASLRRTALRYSGLELLFIAVATAAFAAMKPSALTEPLAAGVGTVVCVSLWHDVVRRLEFGLSETSSSTFDKGSVFSLGADEDRWSFRKALKSLFEKYGILGLFAAVATLIQLGELLVRLLSLIWK